MNKQSKISIVAVSIIACAILLLVLPLAVSPQGTVDKKANNTVLVGYDYNSVTYRNTKTNVFTTNYYSDDIYFDKVVNLTDDGKDLILQWKDNKVKIKLNAKEQTDKAKKNANSLVADKKINYYRTITKNLSTQVDICSNSKDSYVTNSTCEKGYTHSTVTKPDYKYEFEWDLEDKNNQMDISEFSIELENLTSMNITTDGKNFFLPDGLVINLEDLIYNNFSLVKSNDKEVKILQKDGSTFDSSKINLDPTISRLNASKDTYLSSASTAAKNYNYGGATTLNVRGGSTAKNALLYFDVSNLETNSTIISANLNLYGVSGSTSATIYAYALTNSWDEGSSKGAAGAGATWNNRTQSVAWTTAGGDYNSTLVGSTQYAGGAFSFDVSTAIEWWNQNQLTNNGFILTTSYTSGDVQFDSMNYTTYPIRRPYLSIDYSPPEPSVVLSPVDNSKFKTNSVNLTCNATLVGKDSNANITGLIISVGTSTFDFDCNITNCGLFYTSFNATTTPVQGLTETFTQQVDLPYDGNWSWCCGGDIMYETGLDVEYLGFSNSPAYFFITDTTAPVISLVSPSPSDSSRTTSNSVTINASVSDLSGISACILQWNNSASVTNYTMTKNGDYCNYTIATTDGTNYQYKVFANDTLGTFGNSSTVSFRENSKPTPPTILLTPTTAYSNSTLTCTATSSDADSDSISYLYQFNDTSGTILQDYPAVHTYNFSGITNPSSTHTAKYNTTDLYEYFLGTEISTAEYSAISTSNNVYFSQSFYNFPIKFKIAENKNTIYNMTLTIEGNCKSGANSCNYKIKQGDSATFQQYLYEFPDSVEVTVNRTLSNSIINSSGYVNLVLTDINNWGVPDTFLIDNIQLIVYYSPNTFNCSAYAQCTKSDTITCNAKAYDSYEYSVINSSAVTILNSAPSITAWNISNSTWSTTTGTNINLYENSTNGTYVFNITSVFDIDSSKGDTVAYDWFIDSVRVTVSVVNSWFSLVLGSYTVGVHNVTAFVNDTSNGKDSKYWNVSINDVTKPALTVTSPIAGKFYSYNTSIALNYSVSDVHLQTCKYNIDNGANITIASCLNTTFNASEGNHLLSMFVNDTSNNINSTTINFTIDTIMPTVTVVSPNNSYNYTTTSSLLEYFVSDLNQNKTWYSLNGATNVTLNNTVNIANFENSLDGFGLDCGGLAAVNYVSGPSNLGVQLYSTGGDGLACMFKQMSSTGMSQGYTIYLWGKGGVSAGFYNSTNFYSTITDMSTGCSTNGNDIYSACNGGSLYTDWRLFKITANQYIGGTIQLYMYKQGALGTGTAVASYYDAISQSANTTLTLAQGTNTIRVYANDTANNVNNSLVTVFVDSINPLISYGNNNPANYANLSQTFVYINTTWTETNLKNITFTLKNQTATVNSTTFTTATYSISWTNLPDTNYSYWVNITDTLNNKNSTTIQYITLDSHAPNATLIFPTNNTVNSTATQNFTANVSDAMGVKNATLYIYNQSNNVLINQTTVSFAPNVLTSTVGIVVTVVDGTYKWFFSIWDWAGNSYNTQNNTITTDTTNPTISNLVVSPSSPATYASGATYYFNTTIIDLTLNTVWIEFNGTNYTTQVRNISSVYMFNRTNLAAGTYSYKWWANDTLGHISSSSSQNYVINQATNTLSLTSSSGWTFNYDQNPTTLACSATFGTPNIYKDGASISNPNVATHSVGAYTIVCNITASQNYSTSTTSNTLTVNKIASTTTLTLTPNTPITYGTQTNATCTTTGDGTLKLYRNGVDVTSTELSKNVTLAAGTHNYICNVTSGTNYQSSTDSKSYVVNNATGNITLKLNSAENNLTVTYPQQTNVTATTLYGTVIIYKDGVAITTENGLNVTRSGGYYNITAVSSGDANHSSATITRWLNITQATRTVTLTFTPSSPIIYGNTVNASCSASAGTNDGTLKLFRNSVDVTSTELNQNVILSAGVHNYVCNITTGTNYTTATTSNSYTINTKQPSGSITSSAGWAINEGTSTTIAISESNTGDSDVTYVIFRDGVSKSTGETWTPSVGTYNYILNTTGGTNYSTNSSMYAHSLVVNDITAPTVTIVYPASNGQWYDSMISVNYTASDTHLQSCWWTNDSGAHNYTLASCTTNITGQTWQQQSNTVTVYANDTSGNVGSATRQFNIDTLYPAIDWGTGIAVDYANLSQTNVIYNVTYTEANLDHFERWYAIYPASCLAGSSLNTGTSVYLNQTGMTENTYTYCYKIFDTVGHTNITSQRVITLDVHNPDATLSTPINGTYNSTTSQNFSATVTDNSGVKNATLTIYNNTGIYNQTTFSFVPSTTTSVIGIVVTLANGPYNWFVKLWDWAGNSYQTPNSTITIDNIVPTLVINSPVNNSNYSNSDVRINFTATDIYLSSCWTNINNGANTTRACSSGNVFSWLDVYNEGLNTVKIYSNDSAGNINSTSITFRIDSTQPFISITTPTNTTYKDQYSYNFTLNVTASDSGIGVSTYWYSLNNGNNITFIPNTTIAPSAGSNTLKVWVNDSVGNVNSTNVTFYLAFTPKINDINVSNSTTSYDRLFLTDGRVAFWTFDKNSTSQEDSSGNGHTATYLTGASFDDTGKVSGALKLDGLTGAVNVSSQLLTTQNFTIILWAKRLDTTSNAFLKFTDSGGANRLVIILDESSMNYYRYNGTYIGRTVSYIPPVNVWEMYTFVETTSGHFIYYNNTLVDSGTVPFGLTLGNLRRLGDDGDSGINYPFNGTLDEVIVFNRSLSLSEITQLYSITNPTFEEYSNNTIVSNITDEDTSQAALNYTWSVDGIAVLTGVSQNIFSWIYDKVSQIVNLVVTDNNNYNVTQTWTISTVQINPTINFTLPTPTNNTYQSSTSLVINITGTEANLNNSWVQINNTNYTLSCTGGTKSANIYYCTYTISGLNNAVYTYTAYVKDKVGIINQTETRTVTIDTISPMINITYPANMSYNSVLTALNYTFVEQYPSICQYSVDGGLHNTTMTCGQNMTGLTANQGSNTWMIRIQDNATNVNQTYITFFVDSINPLINFTSPTLMNNINVSQANIFVNVSWTETNFANITFTLKNDTSIVNSTTFTTPTYNINWTNLPDLNYTYWVNITDVLNNKNSTEIRYIVLDVHAPTAIQLYPNDNVYNKTLTQNFTVNLTDNSGLKNSTLYIYNSSNNLINSTTVTFASNTLQSVVGIVVTLVDNTYHWFFDVYDYAGNYFATTNRTIVLDSTFPRISYNPSTATNGIWKQTGDIYVNISVIDANINTVKLSWNNVNQTFTANDSSNYWINKTGLSTGTYTFYAWTNDSAGNFNLTATRTVYVDLENPILTITLPEEKNYNYNTSLPLNFTATDTNLQTCWYNIDNGANVTVLCTSGIMANATFSTYEGSHIVNVYVNDSSGRLTNASRPFAVYLQPPSISVSAPLPTGVWLNYKNNINISFTPSATTSLSVCQLWGNFTGTWKLNNTKINPTNNALTTFQLNLTDNFYSFNIWCNDSGNNGAWANPFANQTFGIDTTYPTINFSSSTTQNNINTTQTSIFVNVSAYDLNENNIAFKLYNSINSYNITTFTDHARTLNWTNLPDDYYYYNVTICDLAGNCNSTTTNSLIIDTTAPTLDISSPQPISYASNNSIDFNYSVADNLVGVSACWYDIYNMSGGSVSTVVIPTTLLPGCSNTSFSLPGGDVDYIITLHANDTLNTTSDYSLTFGIRTESPAVNLGISNGFFFNHLNNVILNTTAYYSEGLSTCELYGNWTGSVQLNQSKTTMPNGVYFNWNALNLTEDIFTAYVRCNNTYNHWGTSYTITFGTDITAPTISLTTPSTSPGINTVQFNTTVIDRNTVTCKYSIYKDDGTLDCPTTCTANIPFTCNHLTSATVSAYGTYNITTVTTDAAGNSQSATQTFTTTPSSPGGGGGGGGVTVVIDNRTWEMTTEYATDNLVLEMTQGSARTAKLQFKNKANSAVNLTIYCEGDLCKYVDIQSTHVFLPVNVALLTQDQFTLKLPNNITEGHYSINFIAVDSLRKQSIVTVEVNVGKFGIPLEVIKKIVSAKQIGNVYVPYILFALPVAILVWALGNYLLFRKMKLGLAFSIILALISALIVLAVIK
jgi:hypothetical protein